MNFRLLNKYIFITFVSNFLFSAYLTDIPVSLDQPDGSAFNCFTSGDEFYHYLHDENGYTIIQNVSDGYYYYAIKDNDILVPSHYLVNSINPQDVGIEKNLIISRAKYNEIKKIYWEGIDLRDAPSIGTIKNINIFIRFEDDQEFPNSRSYYDIPFNKLEGPSMYHYYKEVSYDLLTVNTVHFPDCDPSINISYQDEYPRSYYSPYNETTNTFGYQNDSQAGDREHMLLKNAVEFISGEVPSELDIDSNDDGYVDNVTFLIRGVPGAWADLLWPHRWVLYTEEAYINEARVWDYNLNLEQGGYFTVGTLCHEFFHSLGAPDLYHYWDEVSPVAVGGWDIMDASADTPQSMSAYMKYRYTDWIVELPILETSGNYEIHPLSSPLNNIYRINSPLSNEYFVVEYRIKEGLYEVNTPGGDNGLIIYRINDTLNGNGNGPPDELYVYRQGGTINSNGSFAGAVFNQDIGRYKFNDNTNPSCFLSDGSPGGINISNVGIPGETIEFDIVNLSLLPEFQEITFDSDGDGIINPGEEVVFNLSILNLSNLNAENIIATILTQHENIEIQNSQINFGNINSYNSNQELITVNLGSNVMGEITFNILLSAIYQENNQDINYYEEFELKINVSLNQSGFPYSTLNEVRTSPVISDLDLNGEYEIIFGDHFGYVHAINSNGKPVLENIFPFDTGGQIWGSIALSDIDNDGYDDIVVVSKSKHLYVIDKDGIKLDFETETQLIATPSIGNIDQDEDLEIVIGGYSSNQNNLLVLNSDGSNVFEFELNINEKNKSGFALADYNNNNLDDIVFGTDSNNLYLIYDNGTIAEGFPFISDDKFRVTPLVIDNQDQKIIIAPSENNHVYGIKKNGTVKFDILFDFKITTTPSVLNVEDNIYIFIGLDNGDIFCFDLDGNINNNYTYNISTGVVGSIVFSDLDSDGLVEIVASNDIGDIYIYHLNGDIFENFPISYNFPNSSSPAIFDVDQDLDLEIYGGTTNSILMLDIKSEGVSDNYWNIFKGDNRRTSFYEFCMAGDLNFSQSLNVLDIIIFIDVILESIGPNSFQSCQIDLNEDGIVNILDLIILIYEILDG